MNSEMGDMVGMMITGIIAVIGAALIGTIIRNILISISAARDRRRERAVQQPAVSRPVMPPPVPPALPIPGRQNFDNPFSLDFAINQAPDRVRELEQLVDELRNNQTSYHYMIQDMETYLRTLREENNHDQFFNDDRHDGR